MSNTITYNAETGEASFEHRGENNVGHRGVYAGEVNEVTGEWVEDSINNEFVGNEFDPWDALPPDHQRQYSSVPAIVEGANEEIIGWLQDVRDVSDTEIRQIVDALDEAGASNDVRDFYGELLLLKSGDIDFSELAPHHQQKLLEAGWYEPQQYFEADDSEEEDLLDYDDPQIQEILAMGSTDEYQAMVGWAATHLNPNDIARYDTIMDSGDAELMQNTILDLYELYESYGLNRYTY